MDVAPPGRAVSDSPPLLETAGLTKRFGSLTACDAIDLRIASGEIHALLGENGAGKSTLVKMLYGALAPDAGEIRWRGEAVSIASPAAARRLGIGMVFQHFSLFEALTVGENIALALPKKAVTHGLDGTIRTVSRQYGLPLDPHARIADLSVGERQRVEIVRCLLQEPRLIIMDEPTSVLTPQESEVLFETLKRLSQEGVAILYITHRLVEVVEIASRATILRRGRVVGTADPRAESARTLAGMMVGSDIGAVDKPEARMTGAERLRLQGLTLAADRPFGIGLQDVTLGVRSGEIVAIAGVAGNGQQELFDAISGERLAASDDAILIEGRPVGRKGVNERRRLGAAFVPEERLGHGAVASFRLSDNVVLTRHATRDAIARHGLIDKKAATDVEGRVAERFDVRRASPDPRASSLSGGNLQKFVVGREIDRAPTLLVVSQPTWGVDAGAARIIRGALIGLAEAGAAILVISQDLDEIFEVADRIAVMSDGRLSEAFPAGSLSPERIGLLMGGVHHQHDGTSDGEAGHAA
ncbi:ABC transporter ATP-binding protein [Propylenella binzhouense]|uniref:ABC transporter ATP-binding protein n=1 Tax=Propylenella binzhouense TaxID=2555902 RepID=A0A964T8P0_9HYPH|nr:ABC transporter ATP-binding protein [Propylenella binzhouense]MYZ49392.1 ABC transporter ATP-binding protein [Propylenella binzhouense]